MKPHTKIILQILFLFWLFMSIFVFIKISSSRNLYYVPNTFVTTSETNSKNNSSIKLSFKSDQDYLGAVTIQFTEASNNKNDRFLFRIRKKGDNHWYMVSSIESRWVNSMMEYPFGFPIIVNSKNNVYEIMITALPSSETNVLRIKGGKHVLITHHPISNNLLFKNRTFLMIFIKQKLLYGLLFTYFMRSSFFLALPFLMYLTFPYDLKKLLEKESIKLLLILRKNVFLLVTIVALGINLLIISPTYDLFDLFIIGTFCINVYIYKLKNSLPFIIALLLLCMCALLLALDFLMVAEKFALWVYYFMIIGLLNELFLLLSKKYEKT